MGLFESATNLVSNMQAGKRAGQRAKQAEKSYWDRIDAANFEPEYGSQHAPEFKKAESPVARAYLESFLTGSNPAAIQSTRLGADVDKAAAQSKFNQAYGGWDKLQAQQQAAQADNSRFKVAPIVRPVQDADDEVSARNPQFADLEKKLSRKLSADEAQYLIDEWGGNNKMFGKAGPIMGDGKGFWLMNRSPEEIERILSERPSP